MFGKTRNTLQMGRMSAILWKRCYVRMSRLFPPLQFSFQKTKGDGDEVKKTGFQLMQQTNLLQGASAGTFYMLPLLTRSLEKLYKLVDEEMQALGAQKVTLPCLAPATLWQATNRWEEMGSELFRFTDRRGSSYCLAPTHEEAITSLVKSVQPVSYKQLPIKLYQIGRKFRDETRPKNGLLRCREFDMKDLYTFDADEASARTTYDGVISAYRRLFDRLNVSYHQVEASTGSMGGQSSHEFHLVSSLGEDTLVQCTNCGRVVNDELIADGEFSCTNCHSSDHESFPGVEIAHCFILGTKYSSMLGATYTDREHKDVPYYMGCYGIGMSRLLGALVEDLDSNHLRWPGLLAPYQVIVVPMQKGHRYEESSALAEKIAGKLADLPNLKNEVILDDRVNMSIGKRLSAAKQVGIPYVVVVGKNSLEEEPKFECVHSDQTDFYTETDLFERFARIETIS